MIIHPRHFIRFIDGRAGQQVVIAYLPDVLAAHLNAKQTAVSLELSYAHKFLKRGLTYHGFDEIQDTIDNGMCIQEDDRRLSFFYIKDPVKPEIYFLRLKEAGRGNGLWLATFHRIRPKQMNNRIKRGRPIRDHFERDIMG